jgi:hypothetical protein
LDEVHVVERAVASLIGAVALAADSDEPATEPATESAAELAAEPAAEPATVALGSVRPAGRQVPGPRKSDETHVPAAEGPGGSAAPGRPAWTTTGTRP